MPYHTLPEALDLVDLLDYWAPVGPVIHPDTEGRFKLAGRVCVYRAANEHGPTQFHVLEGGEYEGRSYCSLEHYTLDLPRTGYTVGDGHRIVRGN